MRVPQSLVAAIAALLAACSSPGAPVHQQTAHRPDAVATPSASPSAEPVAPPTVYTACALADEPPVPAPRAAGDSPTAPRTTVAIVGTVCSAASGEPLAGLAVSARMTAAFCAEGHQPWRCFFSTVTDRQGHYGLTLFDLDTYDVTVAESGYRASGGLVQVAHTGVTRVDWMLTPMQ